MSNTTRSAKHFGITYASLMTMPPATGIQVAQDAASLGYGSFWTAETTGPEAFSVLSAAGAATNGTMGLGTGVLALQLRTPMVVAMAGATLQSLHPDAEIILGIGISSPVVATRWHGAPYGQRPLAQVREFVTLVKECLSGEPVTFSGDFYQCKKFRLGVRLGSRKPKVVVGALNPRMLSLAGEVADGVLLNYLPASHVPWSLGHVHAGETTAGRPAGSCTAYGYIHVGVCDRADGVDLARKDLFNYAVVDAYARNFAAAGFGPEVEAIRQHHQAGDRAGAMAAVSDQMVDAIDVMGDANHIRSTVASYVDAGIDVPVIMPLPWGPDRMAVVQATLQAAIATSPAID